MRKIKHNVIVHVKDLNITYIDSDASVIASASCQEISCYPTDGNWLKAFLVYSQSRSLKHGHNEVYGADR